MRENGNEKGKEEKRRIEEKPTTHNHRTIRTFNNGHTKYNITIQM